MKFRFIILFIYFISLAGCTAEWSTEEREYVYNHCLQLAIQQGLEEPQNHCSCAISKFEKASPNPEDIVNLNNKEIMDMATSCQDSIKAVASFKRIFLVNCIQMATQSQLKGPEKYCDCVMNKIIAKYHDQIDMSQVEASVVQELGKSCE